MTLTIFCYSNLPFSSTLFALTTTARARIAHAPVATIAREFQLPRNTFLLLDYCPTSCCSK